MSMLTLEPALSAPPPVLDVPGGFLWWYADLFDEAGSGAVLIWSYGLPFLPGLASAERAGRPIAARGRPALNLAVYERGRQVYYALQELPPEPAPGEGPEWRFGRSRIAFTGAGGRGRLVAELELDVAGGGQARARIEVEGMIRRGGTDMRGGGAEGGGDLHGWSPILTGARGSLAFDYADRRRLEVAGHGYHDRNWGRAALHRLGIRHWCWGRLPDGAGGEWIWYALRPEGATGEDKAEDLIVRVEPDGGCAVVPGRIALEGWGRDRFGLGMPARVRVEPEGAAPMLVEHEATLDRGPFYLRWLTRTTEIGADGTSAGAKGSGRIGVAERCRPDRIDDPRWRDFVAMCVTPAAGSASPLLPWFSGPVEDRGRRLIRSLLGGAA